MEFTSIVLYDDGLAHYSVSSYDGRSFHAHLLLYTGALEKAPPSYFEGTKSGAHWVGSTERPDLLEDLGYDVSLHFKKWYN